MVLVLPSCGTFPQNVFGPVYYSAVEESVCYHLPGTRRNASSLEIESTYFHKDFIQQ